jgi:hypothetical protein
VQSQAPVRNGFHPTGRAQAFFVFNEAWLCSSTVRIRAVEAHGLMMLAALLPVGRPIFSLTPVHDNPG